MEEELRKITKVEEKKGEYFKRVQELSHDEYDENIVKLYENSFICKDGIKYPTASFYLVYGLKNDNIQIYLVCIKKEYNDYLTGDIIDFKRLGIIKLKDTTTFIDLIKSKYVTIENNVIIINKDCLENINVLINNWDGMIHDQVKETKALLNKQIVNWNTYR